MKGANLAILLLLLQLTFSCNNGFDSDPEVLDQLNFHIDNNEWFKFKSFYTENSEKLSVKDSLLYGAYVDMLFRNKKSIIEDLTQLESRYKKALSNEDKYLILKIRRSIYKRDSNSKKLKEINEFILSKYDHLADSSFKEDLKSENAKLACTQHFPPPKPLIRKDIHIPISFEEYSKLYAKVKIGNKSFKFIIDSGCSSTIISSSVAEECNLKVFDSGVSFMSIVGDSLFYESAFIDEMNIGDLRIKNVLCDVLETEKLGVPESDFYIEGIIGFDLLEQLGEVRIINLKEMIIPQYPKKYGAENFTFINGPPLYCGEILTKTGIDTLRMKLDLGGYITMLYKKYYDSYTSEVKASYPEEIIEYGSLGGQSFFHQYIMDSLSFSVADTSITLLDIGIHTTNTHKGVTRDYHGILGMDFMSQFDEIIISFDSNSIIFQ